MIHNSVLYVICVLITNFHPKTILANYGQCWLGRAMRKMVINGVELIDF